MFKKAIKTVVVGSLNTDIVLTGLKGFPAPGTLAIGERITIGPGGKSRNIASMMASLSTKGAVAMVGRTCKDSFGLWRPPFDALRSAGVNVQGVLIDLPIHKHDLPGIALIPIDLKGQNQFYLAMGANRLFSPAEIRRFRPFFAAAASNGGTLVLTMELPFETAMAAVKQAKREGLRVMVDPGGIDENSKLAGLLALGVDIIKPNEFEAKLLTGIEVTDLESAAKAGRKLSAMGVAASVITVGPQGAYVFEAGVCSRVPCAYNSTSKVKDATGCGDQTMAALTVFLQKGVDLLTATKIATLAGSMQFYRLGIQPVNSKELQAQITKKRLMA